MFVVFQILSSFTFLLEEGIHRKLAKRSVVVMVVSRRWFSGGELAEGAAASSTPGQADVGAQGLHKQPPVDHHEDAGQQLGQGAVQQQARLRQRFDLRRLHVNGLGEKQRVRSVGVCGEKT